MIQIDGVTTQNNPNTGSNTWAFTTPSGSGGNRLLLVAYGNAAGTAGNASAMTYNALTMTRFAQNTTLFSSSWWYLIDPPVGSFNIIKTGAGATGKAMIALALSNVDQTTPLVTGFATNGVGPPSGVVGSVAVTDLVLATFANNGATDPDPPTNGGTSQGNVLTAAPGNVVVSSKGPGVTGSQTMSWTNGSQWGGVGIRVQNQDYADGNPMKMII